MAFGNKDENQEYPITQDAIDHALYVVLHFDNFKEQDPNNPQKSVDTGQIDNRTKRIQTYKQGVFDELTRENEQGGKVNMLNKMLGKYIVLHDPTLDVSDGESEDLMSFTKAELLEKVKALNPQPSEDELKGIDTASKPVIVELLTKYKTPNE